MPSVCEMLEGQTTRPNLLTEADLVSLMDKNGIGESGSNLGVLLSLTPGSPQVRMPRSPSTSPRS